MNQKRINKIFTQSLFSGEYNKGISQLEALEKKTENNILFLSSLGLLYDHLAMESEGRKKALYERKAKGFYTKILKLKPNDPRSYKGFGRIAFHSNKYKEGIDWYRKALEVKSKTRYNKLDFAVALIWGKKYNEAKKILLADWSKYGPSFKVAYNLTYLAKETKNKSLAKRFSKEAMRLWKKKPKEIRNSTMGKMWEEYIKIKN